MLVKCDPVDTFRPVTLTLTLESQKEIEVLYAIFNVTSVCDFACSHGVEPTNIRNKLPAGESWRYTDELNKKLKAWGRGE